jgi:hypothetical protein
MGQVWDVWRATPEWQGEIAFIVAGGPSVLTQDLNLLQGRKTIAINCSYKTLPNADFMIFADSRFYYQYKADFCNFKGRIICAAQAIYGPPLHGRMHRKATPGLADDTATVMVAETTVTAAINLAVHLGVRAIVLLGLDGKKAADGRTHHHEPHPWRMASNCWDRMRPNLQAIANDLERLDIVCLNASPGSNWADIWPIVDLPQAIAQLDVGPRAAAAAA